jgi:hypothetical protein
MFAFPLAADTPPRLGDVGFVPKADGSDVHVGVLDRGPSDALTDIPIEQPMRFKLIVNAKTAKALSLTLPPSLLALADEVIE